MEGRVTCEPLLIAPVFRTVLCQEVLHSHAKLVGLAEQHLHDEEAHLGLISLMMPQRLHHRQTNHNHYLSIYHNYLEQLTHDNNLNSVNRPIVSQTVTL